MSMRGILFVILSERPGVAGAQSKDHRRNLPPLCSLYLPSSFRRTHDYFSSSQIQNNHQRRERNKCERIRSNPSRVTGIKWLGRKPTSRVRCKST